MNGEEVKQTDSNFDNVSKAQTEGTNALFSGALSPLKADKGKGYEDEMVSASGGGGAASSMAGQIGGDNKQ